MKRTIIILVGLLFSLVKVHAQSVSGTLTDSKTREPIPFANIWVPGTTQGTMTNNEGYFSIDSPQKDTLYISSVGYKNKLIPIDRHRNTKLNVSLDQNVETLGEVTVKPEIPRAKVLFNLIQEHKAENHQELEVVDNYNTLQTTTAFIAVDTTSTLVKSFSNINDVSVNIGNHKLRFSPIYLSEKAATVTANGKKQIYEKEDGIFPRINQAIKSLIINNVVVNMDFYNDQIYIMDRGFLSPLTKSALSHYNLYLNDSSMVDSTKYFHFSFAPKNDRDPLFSGKFTIEDGTFALTSIDAYISQKANINFVNGFSGNVSFKKLPNGKWFYDHQQTGVNLSLKINKDSLSAYSSKRMDNVAKGNWLVQKTTQYSTSDHLTQVDPAKWDQQPEFSTSNLESNTYSKVDKLKKQNLVKVIDKIGSAALTSYFNVGKLDVGPVFSIYTTNTIEGNRITIPLRTSQQMWERFSFGGFLGYGTKNSKFKYGINLIYQPQRTDKFIMRLNYHYDYELVTQDKFLRFVKNNPNTKGNSNFIAAFTTREKNPYLKLERGYDFRLEYNSPNDNHLELNPYLVQNTGTPAVPFIHDQKNYTGYKTYGLLLNVRLAFGQHYDKFYFDRVYYVNRIPVLNLSMDIGQTLLPGHSMLHSGLYTHLHGAITGRLTRGQIFMNYMWNAGFLAGDAPYESLDQPVGSMSLGYSKYRFNLLHHAAFAHNLYTNVHLHINGGGVLLNRIPVIKTLKLREVVSLKGHYGMLNKAYKGVFELPSFYSNVSQKPYGEIGVGLTNIFKVLRVEYVHLLGKTYQNRLFTDRSGLFFRAEMSF